MSNLSYDKLDAQAIAAALNGLRGWSVEDGALTKLYEFDCYPGGVLFAVGCARLAESLNHHPDLLIGYRKVRVLLRTHDAGGGLTAYDFELARRIDERL